MRILKRLNPFRLPTGREVAMRHLEEAERELELSEYYFEHYQFEVKKLQHRVNRLKGIVGGN